MLNLKQATLAVMLTTTAQGTNAETPDFQMPVAKGGNTYVPVYCNRLDSNGNVTPAFVKAMGIESHFSRIDAYSKTTGEERIEEYLHHLNGHQHAKELTRERIEIGAEHCRKNYREP